LPSSTDGRFREPRPGVRPVDRIATLLLCGTSTWMVAPSNAARGRMASVPRYWPGLELTVIGLQLCCVRVLLGIVQAPGIGALAWSSRMRSVFANPPVSSFTTSLKRQRFPSGQPGFATMLRLTTRATNRPRRVGQFLTLYPLSPVAGDGLGDSPLGNVRSTGRPPTTCYGQPASLYRDAISRTLASTVDSSVR
jgi:hypothetical protein